MDEKKVVKVVRGDVEFTPFTNDHIQQALKGGLIEVFEELSTPGRPVYRPTKKGLALGKAENILRSVAERTQ
jgi:hypothetical protein